MGTALRRWELAVMRRIATRGAGENSLSDQLYACPKVGGCKVVEVFMACLHVGEDKVGPAIATVAYIPECGKASMLLVAGRDLSA